MSSLSTSNTTLLDDNKYSQNYSDVKTNLLLWLPRATAPFSILGSICIIYMSTCNLTSEKERKTKAVYHRMNCAMSIFNIALTIWFALTRIPVPKETGYPGAYGTVGTCTAQGFFIQWVGLSASFHNGALMLYYLLAVKYGTAEGNAKAVKFEIGVVLFAVVVPFIIAIIGIPLTIYNPTHNAYLCVISDYPLFCTVNDEVDCIRGHYLSGWIMWLWIGLPYTLFLFTLFGSLFAIYYIVRQQEIKMSKYASASTCTGTGTNQRELKHTKKVAKQSLFYSIIFFNTYVWFYILAAVSQHRHVHLHEKQMAYVDSGSSGDLYPLVLLTFIFFPNQGIWNFIMYTGPRYKNVRKVCPDKSFLFALKESIFGNMEEYQQLRKSGRTTASNTNNDQSSTQEEQDNNNDNYDDNEH